MYAGSGAHDRRIQPDPEFHHGFEFVAAIGLQQISGFDAKALLQGNGNRTVLFTVPSHIEQREYDAARTYPHKVVEVPAQTLPIINGSHLTPADSRNIALKRVFERHGARSGICGSGHRQ